MRKIQTEVLVIGGGATGTGVVRDLAMRGFASILVEKGDLTYGTTGRYHGLLHSGGRYVVKDPQAARECIEENQILRRIMPECIEDTGGFFVVTPWDDPSYVSRFMDGCKKAGIPVEDVPIRLMLAEENLLNPKITQCFRVPDASADSYLAADLNAISARQYGASILSYHKVIELQISGQRLVGALCHDIVNDEQIMIFADMIINASGAWAGHIAQLAGLDIQVICGKGTMIAVNHRIVNTVINRCKLPSDGDILVPAHTVSIIGTTDIKVPDPDHYAIEPWEVDFMLEEGEKLIPGFKDMRMLRAWAGVRPLYQESSIDLTRDITRAYVLLDHQERDGLDGFVTITSGKWTTYRKMAQETVDLVCRKLRTQRECRTHLEALPSRRKQSPYLGDRLAEIEAEKAYGELICECELATYADVVNSIKDGQAKTIDDIRRDIRLGMGPCQGGFCTLRAGGILHQLRQADVHQTNVAMRDFLQERWKGLLPILWGQQLRQERLNEFIYLNLLNIDHIPGPKISRLSPIPYNEPVRIANTNPTRSVQVDQPATTQRISSGQSTDALIIGAGLAGLMTAWRAAKLGKRIRIVSKGWGQLFWHSGCIDVFGYLDSTPESPVISPAEAIASTIKTNSAHPYALTSIDIIERALTAFQEIMQAANYPMLGSLERNWLLPTATGAFRPTCLAPATMISGDLQDRAPMLIIGIQGYHDFYADLVADNLNAQGIPANALTIKMSALEKQKTVTGAFLAQQFDKPGFCDLVVQAIKSQWPSLPKKIQRVGLPAVLGMNAPFSNMRALEEGLGLPVFEIPTLPPSIPGIRLNQILFHAIKNLGAQLYIGMQVMYAQTEDGNKRRIASVWTEAATRHKPHLATNYVLATGGILGGGFFTKHTGIGAGLLQETIFNLPLSAPVEHSDWFQREFISRSPHRIYSTGIQVNAAFQPVDSDNCALYDNLFIAGNALAGGDYLRERSQETIALASGYLIGERI